MNEKDGPGDDGTPGGLDQVAAPSKPRVISAGDTFFAKFGISAGLLVVAVLLVWGTLRDLAGAHEPAISPLRVAGNLACIGMSMSFVWWLARAKRVALSETSLHVSNFLREIVVPLNEVNSVNAIEGTFYRVVIEFKSETRFGRRIYFSPKGLTPPRPHPILAELRATIAAATH